MEPIDLSGAPIQRPRRKNTTKACLECRRRKAKCDGKTPSCSRCAARLYHCQYADAEDGRRPASKCYVTLLRNRIAILERVLRHHSIDIDETIALLDQSMDVTSKQGGPAIDAEGVEDSWTISDLCVATQGVLSFNEGLNFDTDGEAHYFGPTSGRLDFCDLPSSLQNQPLETRNSGFKVYGLRHSYDYLVQSIAEESNVPQNLKDHLIDLYFTWEQPWYPVVNEHLFRHSERANGRYCSPLLLNSIMAVGSRYSDGPEVLTDPNDKNTAGRVFLERAEVLLHDQIKRPDITTIQALAILSIAYIANGNDSLGLLHQHMAKGMAVDMGFNLDPKRLAGSLSLPADEIELRRQIYWSLYCNDKLAGAYIGRTCTMLSTQAAVELPSLVTSVDSASEAHDGSKSDAPSLLLGLVRICQILERILVNLYAPTPTLQAEQQKEFLTSCLLDLRNWLYDLPSEMRVSPTNRDVKQPHVYILHMVYQTAQILLMKPFSKLQHENRITTHRTAPDLGTADTICLRSAIEMCNLTKRYRQATGTFRRSPISATHCMLSAALVLLQEGYPDTSNRWSYIETCLIGLEELSHSWDIARTIRSNLLKLCRRRLNAEDVLLLDRYLGSGKDQLPPPHEVLAIETIASEENEGRNNNNSLDETYLDFSDELTQGFDWLDNDFFPISDFQELGGTGSLWWSDEMLMND